jgi:hypothetical protein
VTGLIFLGAPFDGVYPESFDSAQDRLRRKAQGHALREIAFLKSRIYLPPRRQALINIRNPKLEIRNKPQPNKSQTRKIQNAEAESGLFETFCFCFVHLNLFRISCFEFSSLISNPRPLGEGMGEGWSAT